jgi:acetyl-CoA acetyltransferase
VNTSGGLVSRGHPMGATGLAMVHELCLQLRGVAGPRQVERCEIALMHNAGGWVAGRPAATAIHILRGA